MTRCRPENYADGTQCQGCGRSWGEDGPEECPLEPLADGPTPTGRWETGMEHAARDMREGRFPERSERQRVPAPAVPDDVEAIAETLRRATFTKGRMHCGIIGQTIEAAMRSTLHEVSAWDLIAAADALEAQAAELARLRRVAQSRAELLTEAASELEAHHPGSGFAASIRAALTHPTGDTGA